MQGAEVAVTLIGVPSLYSPDMLIGIEAVAAMSLRLGPPSGRAKGLAGSAQRAGPSTAGEAIVSSAIAGCGDT